MTEAERAHHKLREFRLLEEFDHFIRRDPARRGLVAAEPACGPLCPGHLAAAADHLARYGRSVLIATGFYIPRGEPPAAETDGPPGALLLAHTLLLAGVEATVVTDRLCWNGLCAAADAQGLPRQRIVCYEDALGRAETAVSPARRACEGLHEQFATAFSGTTHLIAVERVGPSHTLASLARQPRQGEAPSELFARNVPEEHRNRCHNMRGDFIDDSAGDMHRLFDDAPQLFPAAKTIGIGDGGNEIGMGVVPWEDLQCRLAGEQAGWLPCRIPCDWNIIAGTSNWGAYALAAAFAHLRGDKELLRPFDAAQQQHVVSAMVENGPAVDGVTRRREPTVDGLTFSTYIEPWVGMRRMLGLDG